MKKKESTTKNQSLTCPNPSCGKVFVTPIKTENKSSENVEVYDACPYCLTEITLDREDKNSVIAEERRNLESAEDENRSEDGRGPERKKPEEPISNVPGCSHHLGYLSQRSSKEKIPEECMVCENIVQCMLKKVTG